MAGLRVMPNVPSSAARVAVPAGLTGEIEARAAGVGLSRDELVELALRAAVQNGPARDLWQSYESGATQTLETVRAALAAATINEKIRGFRLSAPAPDRSPVPWKREGAGVELTHSAAQAWPMVRGLWRFTADGVHVIAGIRLGQVVGVYRVQGWVSDLATGRKYAIGGQAITSDGLLQDVETGATSQASAEDRAIEQILRSRPILMTGRQPVVLLSTR